MTTLLGDESIALLKNAGMNVGIDWTNVVAFPVPVTIITQEDERRDERSN